MRRTVYLLLGGLILSVGTPMYLGLTRPGAGFYLFQPWLFWIEAVPYLVAAGLWLPWRSPRARTTAQLLAGVLFSAAVLLYGSILTGLLPTGGDMVGLGYVLIALVTTASILVVTIGAFGILWIRERRARS